VGVASGHVRLHSQLPHHQPLPPPSFPVRTVPRTWTRWLFCPHPPPALPSPACGIQFAAFTTSFWRPSFSFAVFYTTLNTCPATRLHEHPSEPCEYGQQTRLPPRGSASTLSFSSCAFHRISLTTLVLVPPSHPLAYLYLKRAATSHASIPSPASSHSCSLHPCTSHRTHTRLHTTTTPPRHAPLHTPRTHRKHLLHTRAYQASPTF